MLIDGVVGEFSNSTLEPEDNGCKENQLQPDEDEMGRGAYAIYEEFNSQEFSNAIYEA